MADRVFGDRRNRGVGERDFFGVGHLTLIPMEVLGLTLLSAQFCQAARGSRWRSSPDARSISRSASSFTRGFSTWRTRAAHRYYAGMGVNDGQFLIGMAGPDSMGGGIWRNWFTKRQPLLCTEWLRPRSNFVRATRRSRRDVSIRREAMREKLDEDDKYWHGWYRDHGGQIGFLGDACGDSDVAFGAPWCWRRWACCGNWRRWLPPARVVM